MFTAKEKRILNALQKNPGEIRFFKDIAEHFITDSQLEISTFSQLAYVNLPASESNAKGMINAQSQYFEVLIFIRKLEKSHLIFHIPFTALENNTAKIGPKPINPVHNTIADADLLIQLFQFAGKKYVFTPELPEEPLKKHSKTDFFRIASLFLLLITIGLVAFHAHLEREHLRLKQKAIGQLMEDNQSTVQEIQNEISLSDKVLVAHFDDLKDRDFDLSRRINELNTTVSNIKSSQNSHYYYLRRINNQIDSLKQYHLLEE